MGSAISRLLRFVQEVVGDKKTLADKIGVNPSSLTNWLGEDKEGSPRLIVIEKILEAYPELSVEYLFRDNGPMTIDRKESTGNRDILELEKQINSLQSKISEQEQELLEVYRKLDKIREEIDKSEI